MKFFWKIFFSTMFVSVFFFALGSYYLIHSSFQAALGQEIKAAYEINDIVYYSLQNEFRDIPSTYLNTQTIRQQIQKTARSISINNMNNKIDFNVFGADHNVLYSSIPIHFEEDILFDLFFNEKAHSLEKQKDKIYIRVVRPAEFLKTSCYIETIRDVSTVFANQRFQYEIFAKIVITLIGIGSVLIAVISKLLMKPIRRLTVASKKIAAGNFQKKLAVVGSDEIAVLSKQFNLMSDKLQQKIDALKEEAEKQELFVAAFSHELKTPLTAIIGFSDRLRTKLKDDEQLSICADYIFTEGKRLEALSMRLLEMVVLQKQKLQCQQVSAGAFFEHIASLMHPNLQERGIQLTMYIEPAVLSIEPVLMETVCINLIDNARKSIESDGKIAVIGKNVPEGYVFSVEDNGKGMAEEELKKITQAFYMVDKSRSRKEGGAGLGLAICDEILKLHGAAIQFSSTIGVGTCVTVLLKGSQQHEET